MTLSKRIITFTLVICLVFSFAVQSYAIGEIVAPAITYVFVGAIAQITIMSANEMRNDISSFINRTFPNLQKFKDDFVNFLTLRNVSNSSAYSITCSSNGNNISWLTCSAGGTPVLHASLISDNLVSIVGGENVNLSKVQSNDKYYYFELANPTFQCEAILVSRTSNSVYNFRCMGPNLAGTSLNVVNNVSIPLESVFINNGSYTGLTNGQKYATTLEALTAIALLLEGLQVVPRSGTAVDTYHGNLPTNINDNWMTYNQGSLVISGIGTLASELQVNNGLDVQENALLQQCLTQLENINYYMDNLTFTLETIKNNQFNFFQKASTELELIRQELTGLSLESGKLFNLTLPALEIIKSVAALILGLFISILSTLGLFCNSLGGYLFFVPTNMLPVITMLPFLCLVLVIFKFVRG